MGLSNIFSLDLRRQRNASVSAHLLDFGILAPETSADQSLYLFNQGETVNDTLIVEDILSDNEAFTPRPRSFPVPPDDSVRVDVTLSSVSGDEQGVLTIRTNDPDHPTLEVQLVSGLAAPVVFSSTHPDTSQWYADDSPRLFWPLGDDPGRHMAS